MLSRFKKPTTPEYNKGYNAGFKQGIEGHNFQEKTLIAESEAKNNAYWERGQLVAHLARQFDSHVINVTGKDNWPIVCIHSPKGQLTWHIPASELSYYTGLPVDKVSDWDGHTTEEKYARLWELTLAE